MLHVERTAESRFVARRIAALSVMAATKPETETDSWTTIWIPVIRIRISIRVSITIRIGVRRYWNRSCIRRPAYCHSHVHPGISFGRCKRQHPHKGKRWKSDFL